jgi:ABC-type taurine transport system ATPase subunit
VAASARETLLDLAAELAKVERGALTIDDGKITHPPSKKSFTFGELTKGKKLTKNVSADAPAKVARYTQACQ